MNRWGIISNIWGSLDNDFEEYCLLEYAIMQYGRNLPTFWWTLAALSVSTSWTEAVGSFNKLVNFLNLHQTI